MARKTSVWAVIAAGILLASMLSGCTSPYQTRTYDVSDFDRIAIDTFGEVLIEQGDQESVSIEAPRDYLRYVTAEVDNSTLEISTRRGYIGGPIQRVTYTIMVRDLKEISLGGAGAIKIFALDTDKLDINLSGAGSVEIDDLNAERLDIKLASAGAIVAAGEADYQEVSITGLGSYEGGDLRTNSTEILLTGAGSAVVWAEQELEIELSGVGSVSYFGNPDVFQDISGLGSVNSKGAR